MAVVNSSIVPSIFDEPASESGIADGAVTTAKIANDAVTLAKMADMATASFIGRTTAGTGNPEVLSATQSTAILSAVVGDSGSGGTKGLVPAPSAGDAAASKFLKADGTWTAVTGYTDEQAQDALGTILVDSTTIDFTYADATPSVTADLIDASVSMAKLANLAGPSVIGRAANSSGVPAAITASSNGTALKRSGNALSFAAIDLTTDVTGVLPVGNGGGGSTTISQTFTYVGNASAIETWTKPTGHTQMMIIAISGGASGGGGRFDAAGNARSGGGGGGSSPVSKWVGPCTGFTTLKVQVGLGGASAAGAAAGNNGGITYVSIPVAGTLSTAAEDAVVWGCSATPAQGGSVGSGSTAGGGNAGTQFAASAITNLGVLTTIAGQAGATGRSASAGDAITPGVSPTTGGAGGGGMNASNTETAGGAVTVLGVRLAIAGGLVNGGAGGDGATAVPGLYTGGSGGGGQDTNSLNGGRGGNGGIGCGSGGGGGGTSGGVGLAGASGTGGDGICIITSW